MRIKVCGGATAVEKVIALVEHHRPNLLIAGVDAGPNAVSSLTCIRRALQRVPDLQVIVWSNVDEPRAVKAAFAAGASAYVLKTARPDDIQLAIRQTYDRSFYLADEGPRRDRVARAKEEASDILTGREIEILQLLAEGYSNAQLCTDGVGHRGHDQVSSFQHLPEARSRESNGGESVGSPSRCRLQP